ncbi:MAG: hypothetical protein QM783_08340 [Phycisphaerales bacterium]
MVLYLASDLLWATRIKSCAEDLGVPARPVRTMDMLEARLADSPVTGVLLDLAAGEEGQEGVIAFAMLGRLKGGNAETRRSVEERGGGDGEKPEVIRVVVFGPHVQGADLVRAKREGADVVMARGALAANLPRVLQELSAAAGGRSEMRDQLTD